MGVISKIETNQSAPEGGGGIKIPTSPDRRLWPGKPERPEGETQLIIHSGTTGTKEEKSDE